MVNKKTGFDDRITAIQQQLAELEPAAIAQQLQDALEEIRVAEEERQQQYEELLSTQAALAAERQRYMALFELAPCGYLVTDLRGVIREANHKAASLLKGGLTGKPLSMFVPKEDRRVFRTRLNALTKTGEYRDWEQRLQPDAPFPALINVRRMHDAQGSPSALLWMIRDISDRKRAEEILKASEERLRTLCDSVPVMTWMADTDMRLTYVNRRLLEFTGRPLEQELGEGWAEGVHPDDLGHCLATIKKAFEARKEFTLEYRHRRADGEYQWLVDKGVPRFTPEGEFLGYIGSCIDITERRQAEERLRSRQAELAHVHRLSAIGEITALMAHELNQPLAAMLTYAKGAVLKFRAEAKANPALDEMLEQMARLAQRAADVVRGIRDFVRNQNIEWQPIDINQLVRDTISLIGTEIQRRKVKTTLQLSSKIPPLKGNRLHLQQLLLNLLLNGVEAMETVNEASHHRRLTLSTFINANHEIELCITDTGTGISPEVGSRLFDPFVSTKKNGLGLGLSICRTIVEAHRGRIWAHSNPECGATFHVALPLNGCDERRA